MAIPIAVRVAALRGRSLTWCSRLSPVIHCSRKGHSAAPVKMRPSGTRAGMNTLNAIVYPAMFHSQAGMMRSAPSRNPM